MLNLWSRKKEKLSVAYASVKQESYWGSLLIEIILKDDSMAATLVGGRDVPKGVGGATALPHKPPKNQNLGNVFCGHDDSKILRDLPFSRNQALKSTGE